MGQRFWNNEDLINFVIKEDLAGGQAFVLPLSCLVPYPFPVLRRRLLIECCRLDFYRFRKMGITLILVIKNSMESYKQREAMSSGRQKGGEEVGRRAAG